MKELLFFCLISLLFIQATCNKFQEKPMELNNSQWNLNSYTLNNKTVSAVNMEGRTAEILFDQERINGNTGCNNFFANYKEVEIGKLEVLGLGLTKMFCNAEGIREQESAVSKILKGTVYYKMEKEDLKLWNERGELKYRLKSK